MTSANWSRFNKYLYKYWKLQAAVVVLGFVSLPLSLVNPYLTKLVVDKAYVNKDLKLFFILAIAGGSVFILNGLLGAFSNYFSRRVNYGVHFDITKDLFRHLQRLPLDFFANRSTGEHIYRMSADISSVSNFVCNFIPRMIMLLPKLLCILAIVFYLNWKLALFAALLVPVTYIQPYLFGKWLKEIARQTILKIQGIFSNLQEVFSHIYLVKALGKEDYEIKKFEKNLTKRISFELKNAKLSSISSFSSSVLNKFVSGVIALYGGYQVIRGTMTLGSLTAVMIYLAQLIGLLKSIGEFYQTVVVSSVTRGRLAEVLDIKPGICEVEDAVPLYIECGEIEFKNVCFGYKKKELVLRDISFLIEPGRKIALVGPSGCGKSTLLNLILRLYEPNKGFILIDRQDVRGIQLKSFRSGVGVALQEPFLWNDTIANNILYGEEGAVPGDAVKAAGIAEAHDFIMSLPARYDTKVGEGACKLSEGQKQRIAIARAVIKKPRVLVLDEAMSSIDSQTEDKIIDNIKRELKNSTVITVSHRLSAIKKMDMVYFLKISSKVEAGTHRELIKGIPEYRKLFAGQIEK